MSSTSSDIRHGTWSGYAKQRCRCDECRDWKRVQNARVREGCKKCRAGEVCAFRHGSKVGYEYHGCRCATCRAGNATRRRSDRANDPDYKAKARAYYGNNAERIRAQVRDRRNGNIEEQREKARKYRAQNIESCRERARDYHWRNRERLNQKQRERYVRVAHLERRKRRETYYDDLVLVERRREASRDYYRRNRERLVAAAKARRQGRRPLNNRYDLTVDVPRTRSGEPWTAVEDSIACRDDITVTEICYMLCRSYASVANRRVLLRKQGRIASELWEAS